MLANGCEVGPSRWCQMCTAAWAIQRARPRPWTSPLWPFGPSGRLKTIPDFGNKFDLTPARPLPRTNGRSHTQARPRPHAQTRSQTRHANTRTHERPGAANRPRAQTRHARPTRPQTHSPTPTTRHGDAINAHARVCMRASMPHAQTHRRSI